MESIVILLKSRSDPGAFFNTIPREIVTVIVKFIISYYDAFSVRYIRNIFLSLEVGKLRQNKLKQINFLSHNMSDFIRSPKQHLILHELTSYQRHSLYQLRDRLGGFDMTKLEHQKPNYYYHCRGCDGMGFRDCYSDDDSSKECESCDGTGKNRKYSCYDVELKKIS